MLILCMIFTNYENLMKNTFFKKFKIFYIREFKQTLKYLIIMLTRKQKRQLTCNAFLLLINLIDETRI